MNNGWSCFCVLIETYWNVKGDTFDIETSFVTVLIETYWNVK